MHVHWWIKIASKCLLGVLPFPYEKLRALATGHRGGMACEVYAQEVFRSHLANFLHYRSDANRDCFLELGPGGSLACGAYAIREGFQSAKLVDVGDFAHRGGPAYAEIVERELGERGRTAADRLRNETEPAQVFREDLNTDYLTGGLASLRSLADESVSFSMSQAVLEHVRKGEFEAMLRELFRAHRPGSISSHRIDFKDHLGGGLNHLRFSDAVWESGWFCNGGFYTNRLRLSQIKAAFARAGFDLLSERLDRWSDLPLPRTRMSRDFYHFDDSDLIVSGADLVFRKSGVDKVRSS